MANAKPTFTTEDEILDAIVDGKITREDGKRLMKQLKEQSGQKSLTVKHGSQGKGNVSVYGLQKKFPVSLYPSQWRRLIDEGIPAIEKFLKEESANLENEKFLKKYAQEKAKERAEKEA